MQERMEERDGMERRDRMTLPASAGQRRGDPGLTACFLEAVAATAFGVAPQALSARRRGPAAVAGTRQAAMYLAHTRLGLSYADAGRLFGRDRTTAAHACRTVEERREEPGFDSLLDGLERLVDLWRELGRLGGGRR